jgi:hypothetical protein
MERVNSTVFTRETVEEHPLTFECARRSRPRAVTMASFDPYNGYTSYSTPPPGGLRICQSFHAPRSNRLDPYVKIGRNRLPVHCAAKEPNGSSGTPAALNPRNRD